MRRFAVAVVLMAGWAGGMVAGAVARAEPYAEGAGPRKVETVDATWKDAKRDREVPVLICYPQELTSAKEAVPVIVFSHGLGGSRTSYQAYGKHWASYGYVVIFPQDHDSDTAAFGKGTWGPEALMKSFVDRAADMGFVLDQAELLNAGKLEGKQYEPFKGKLDLKHIGMAGHSLGAVTTTAVAGQVYTEVVVAGKPGFGDKRVTAGLAMSPFPPWAKGTDLDAAYGSIKIPVFYMTGSEDDFGAKPEERRIPYDHSKVAGTALLTLKGADHLTFVPVMGPWAKPEKAEFQKLIREASTAYWDAMLKGDERAKGWLRKELGKEVGERGKFEEKGGGK